MGDGREGWLTQEEAAGLLGACGRTFRPCMDRYGNEGLEGSMDKRLQGFSRWRAPPDEVTAVPYRYGRRHAPPALALIGSLGATRGPARRFKAATGSAPSPGEGRDLHFMLYMDLNIMPYRSCVIAPVKGVCKNKFSFSGVEARAWQGARRAIGWPLN